MNLQHLIEHYIAFERALGASFQANTNVLRAFARAIGPDTDVADVRIRQVRAFLASGSRPNHAHLAR